MEKKIKLSEKQKEVIRKMRSEWDLKQNTVSGDNAGFLISNSRFCSQVNSRTVSALIKYDVVASSKKIFPFEFFSLTDLGKTIEIN